jgi:hypothetical protein
MNSRTWNTAALVAVAVMVGSTVATQNQTPAGAQPSTVKSVGRGAPVASSTDFDAVGPGRGGGGGRGGARAGGPAAPGAPGPGAQAGRGAPGAPAGRGAPGAAAPGAPGAPAGRGGGRGGAGAGFNGSARNGETPPGIEKLPTDIFTSKDFYKDQALWTDKRYFRCNSGFALESQWAGGAIIGDNPPATAAWGYCDRDIPREAIVSPYPFKTAQEHYQALLKETQGRGGPTNHTYATVPGEWTGRYGGSSEHWFHMTKVQISTVMTQITP